MDQLYKAHQYVVMSAPTMAQYGALAGVQQAQDDVETMRRAYDARRRVLVDGLNSAGLPTFEPEGAFYCFPPIFARLALQAKCLRSGSCRKSTSPACRVMRLDRAGRAISAVPMPTRLRT